MRFLKQRLSAVSILVSQKTNEVSVSQHFPVYFSLSFGNWSQELEFMIKPTYDENELR
jgi:hypothetical protein